MSDDFLMNFRDETEEDSSMLDKDLPLEEEDPENLYELSGDIDTEEEESF